MSFNTSRLKLYQRKHSLSLGSKGEATFVSDLLFQRLVVLENGCDINFDNCKRHELSISPSTV